MLYNVLFLLGKLDTSDYTATSDGLNHGKCAMRMWLKTTTKIRSKSCRIKNNVSIPVITSLYLWPNDRPFF